MNIVITCGGTAGHINPGLAIADRIRELHPDANILFIGSKDKMEMELVPRFGHEIRGITVSNISREHTLEAIGHNLKAVNEAITSTIESRKILKEFHADAVLGTGGYVCYPVLKAASELHIPTAVHESNAVPGLTTKMVARFVDLVMVGFEESKAFYPNPEKVIVTGTPVRDEFSRYTREMAKKELQLNENEPLVVSVWGSLGSGHMNRVIGKMIPLIHSKHFHMIHSIGNDYFDTFMDQLSRSAPNCSQYGIDCRAYIYDMARVLMAADLVLCRAGASTLAELTYIGKPAIIVPSPNVTNHHQEKNAHLLEKCGAAVVLLEGEFDESTLFNTIQDLLSHPERLQQMSANMRSLAVDDAAPMITEHFLRLIRNNKVRIPGV